MVSSIDDNLPWIFGLSHNMSNSHIPNNHSDIDVLQKSCYSRYDMVACLRTSGLCFLYLFSMLFASTRIIKLHLQRHKDFHYFIIFYIAILQCLIGCSEWLVGWVTQASLVCFYLRCVQLIVVFHHYVVLLLRSYHLSDAKVNASSSSFPLLIFGYITGIFLLGIITADTPWIDCFAVYWICLCGGQIVITHSILVVILLLWRRLDLISLEDHVKRAQRRDLILLSVAIEIGCLVSFGYHLSLWMLASAESGCSGIFHHRQLVYSYVKVALELVTFLVPMWTFLWVFRHRNSTHSKLVESESGSVPGSSGMQDPAIYPPPIFVERLRYQRRAQMLGYRGPSILQNVRGSGLGDPLRTHFRRIMVGRHHTRLRVGGRRYQYTGAGSSGVPSTNPLNYHNGRGIRRAPTFPVVAQDPSRRPALLYSTSSQANLAPIPEESGSLGSSGEYGPAAFAGHNSANSIDAQINRLASEEVDILEGHGRRSMIKADSVE